MIVTNNGDELFDVELRLINLITILVIADSYRASGTLPAGIWLCFNPQKRLETSILW